MKTSGSKLEQLQGKPYTIAIVLSRYNDDIGNELLKNTQESLLQCGMKPKNIHLYRVPGALEIPVATNALALQGEYDAIICLGVVIRGDTPHFDLVSNECYRGLMNVSLETNIPVIFGILTTNNLKQAKERALKNKMNKGKEFAEAAIEMAMLLQR